MKVVGIDYSMASPSITIINDGVIEGIFCIKATKKQAVNTNLITLLEYPVYKNNMERFDKLSDMMLNGIPLDIHSAYIEDYSFASSSGMAFTIAENTMLFKYKFMKKFNMDLGVIAPKQAKKFATGTGNASKRGMVDQFKLEQFDIYESFGLIDDNLEKIKSPIDDICDSYFIAKYAYQQAITQELKKTK